MEPREALRSIYIAYTGLAANRVVFYNQNFPQPKDRNPYIIIADSVARIVGRGRTFNSDTNEETVSISYITDFAVEMISRGKAALNRRGELVEALYSQIALIIAAEEGIRLFRSSEIIDLSAVEGAGSLHRYRMDVKISHVKAGTRLVEVYDKFRTPEEIING
jgi:hypothetical protein